MLDQDEAHAPTSLVTTDASVKALPAGCGSTAPPLAGAALSQAMATSSFDVGDTPTGKYAAIAAGSNHACGLRVDQSAVCWGSNNGGKAMPPSDKFIAIAAGDIYSCAIRVDGTAVCWGLNNERRSSPPSETLLIAD